MMSTRSLSRTGVLLGLLVLLLASCETLRFSMMKDDELVAGGIQAWNSDRIDAAKAYWNAVKDPSIRSEWLAKADQYDALEKSFDDAAALPGTPEAPLLAAWNQSQKDLKAFPAELKLPDTFLGRLVPVAKAIVRGRLDAEKNASAKEFMKTASAVLGDRIEWSAELQEIQDYDKMQSSSASYRALDKSLDKSTADTLAAARDQEQFDDKIAGYEAAITAFTKAENTMAAQAKANGYKEGSSLALLGDKYRKRRAETRTEMEKSLRDRATSFKERIGEVFARTPEGDKVGSMGPEDILRFYEQTRTDIEAMQGELVTFAGKYPKVIDKDMLKDVDDQKKALEVRIVEVTAEVKKAQADAKIAAEIASRGKAVIPLLIGLFNPQPGAKGTDAKSRPGKFRGTLEGDAVYWWGMESIDKDTMNDLVITVNDNRPVRVFADNTKSGALIDGKKIKDLVNRQYKVGNSWPVINAGAQLPSGRYFFELGKGKEAKYTGDVVVYSSFIVRMR
jgi:hypothetical protein